MVLPVHRTPLTVFNYEEIPAGYYHKVMLNGSAIQRFWHKRKFSEVARRIGDSDSVLDFGCGPGSFLSVLADMKPRCRSTGMDVAGNQIEFARAHIAPEFSDRVNFQSVETGKEALPVAPASVDAFTCIEVIEHIHPFLANRILSEARRVLKPGGKLLLTTPNYRSLWPFIEWVLERRSPVKYHDQHISRFTPSSLVKFVETAGFEVVRVDSIFLLAPFLAGVSWAAAEVAHQLEMKGRSLLGSLLLLEARPMVME